jgi:D-glycero-beta-D-manno-heptose 1-phosphate adenylyltransferase
MENLIARSDLAALADKLRKEGKRIVTTNGCFDILHVGHVRILNQARHQGDVLIVGINSDESVQKLKGPSRPINSERDRAEVLLNLRSVDYVTVFGEQTPVEFLTEIKPNIHVKGADYTPEQLAETPVVTGFGGVVKILELVPGKSTSSIVSRIQGDRS